MTYSNQVKLSLLSDCLQEEAFQADNCFVIITKTISPLKLNKGTGHRKTPKTVKMSRFGSGNIEVRGPS